MYLGQVDVTYDTTYETGQAPAKSESAETVEAVAELTRAVTEPAAQAYADHLRADVNESRIKAGLPPLGPIHLLPPPPPPPEENFAFGAIALLVIIYLLMFKS